MEIKKERNPRELAQAHWAYTKQIIRLSEGGMPSEKLMEYLYVEAMVHGIKHGIAMERERWARENQSG